MFVELLGIKRREMRVENNKDHLLDIRNLIYKEGVLSRYSNAEIWWYKFIVPWALYQVDISAHD